MTNAITRIAAAAAIALAALPVVALGSAHAAQPGARIAVSKIDFSRPENVAAFNSRIGAVQRQFCADGQKRSLADMSRCREAVRAEIVSQLTRQQRIALGDATPTRG